VTSFPTAAMRLGRGASRASSINIDSYSAEEANGGRLCARSADTLRNAIKKPVQPVITLRILRFLNCFANYRSIALRFCCWRPARALRMDSDSFRATSAACLSPSFR
jgi:hypothetical protein